MLIATVVPHGDIPDERGFAPSIVAQELATRYKAHQSLFVCLDEAGKPIRELWRGFQIERYRMGRMYKRLFNKVTRIDPWPMERRIASRLKQYDPDLVHVHQIEFPVNSFRRRFRKDVPIVAHVHALRSASRERGLADKYVAVSEYTKKRMVNDFGYCEESIAVVRNGVDLELFRPPQEHEVECLKKELGLPQGSVVLGYVGRRQECKGYNKYLKILDHLSSRHEHVYGLLAGPEPPDARRDPTWLESRAIHDALVSTGRLKSFPAVTHDELSEYYRVMDIVISLTTHKGEQFPVMLVEAMASGAVVITTPIAGIPEIVTDGENGFLMNESSDVIDVASFVEELMGSSDRREAIGASARRTAECDYSWEALSRRMEDVFESLS